MEINSDNFGEEFSQSSQNEIKIIQIDSYILNSKKKNRKPPSLGNSFSRRMSNTPPYGVSPSNLQENIPHEEQSETSPKVFHFVPKEKPGAFFAPGPDRRSANRTIVSSHESLFEESELTFEKQFTIIEFLYNQTVFQNKNREDLQDISKIYIQGINKKISSYRSQDINKSKFDANLFIDYQFIIEKLFNCKLECFYCKKKVMIIYPIVRESSQWSLERIDNNFGHNKNNVEIACLTCNLKRRTMYHQKYISSQKFGKLIKIDGSN